MPQQLAYVIVTPYTLSKSRTGGILARLITRTGLELVGARMFAPSPELARRYAEVIVSADDPQDRKIQELIRDYVVRNFAPDPKTGLRRRVMVVLGMMGSSASRGGGMGARACPTAARPVRMRCQFTALRPRRPVATRTVLTPAPGPTVAVDVGGAS